MIDRINPTMPMKNEQMNPAIAIPETLGVTGCAAWYGEGVTGDGMGWTFFCASPDRLAPQFGQNFTSSPIDWPQLEQNMLPPK
jgi:hypothetical protein